MDKKRKTGIGIAAVLLALALGGAAWYCNSAGDGKTGGEKPLAEETAAEEKDDEESHP